jgi:plastocyanin
MDRRIGLRCVVAGIAVALGVALTACGSGTNSGNGPTVTVHNIAYNPTTITVAANTQVTINFVNQDNTTHSLTFDNDASKSVDAQGGSTQTLTFTAPAAGATISFHCNYHSSMHGTINVGASSGSSAGAPGASPTPSSPGGY